MCQQNVLQSSILQGTSWIGDASILQDLEYIATVIQLAKIHPSPIHYGPSRPPEAPWIGMRHHGRPPWSLYHFMERRSHFDISTG